MSKIYPCGVLLSLNVDSNPQYKESHGLPVMYKESIQFFNRMKKNLITLYVLIIAWIIFNLISLLFKNELVNNDIKSLFLLMMFFNTIFLFTISIVITVRKKELIFKRFEIGRDYIIMPYIVGIRIPNNKIPFSSIFGVGFRNRGLPYFLMYVDTTDIKRDFPNLGNVQPHYVLEYSLGKLFMKSVRQDRFVILVDKNDFSEESYAMLLKTLEAQNVLKDLDKPEV